MKKKWKSKNYNSVRQIVEANTQITAEELLHPQKNPYIRNLMESVKFVKQKVKENTPIHIVGDYDADGDMASAIMKLCLQAYGCNQVHVRLPRRFSEGYGLSMKIIDEISDGLIITVDNGITAIDQIACAKRKGLAVIILDHHLPAQKYGSIILPDADYIIDPHAISGSDFSDYCGAGLAYRFAQELLTEAHPLMNSLLVLASIATVADMVPLTGDNHAIVKEGLKNINKRNVTFGLQILLDKLQLNSITEDDYGYLIGPVMNASGRMLDDGPVDVVNLVTALADPANPDFIRKTMYLQNLADELVNRNELRKKTVERDLSIAESIIHENGMQSQNPLVLFSKDFWEGTVGILAGKLAEKYQVPCLVLTKSATDGIAKGSGRTFGNINLKMLLDDASDILENYGGHAPAAGLSVKIKHLTELQQRLSKALTKQESTEEIIDFYDMTISENDIPKLIDEVKKYAPYGIGNPKPVFLVKNFACSPVAGKFLKELGERQTCMKFTGRTASAVAFNLTETYKESGEPKIMNIIGTLSEKNFKWVTSTQVEIIDFENAENHKKSEFFCDLEKQLSFI